MNQNKGGSSSKIGGAFKITQANKNSDKQMNKNYVNESNQNTAKNEISKEEAKVSEWIRDYDEKEQETTTGTEVSIHTEK